MVKHYITVKNKRYEYTIKRIDNDSSHVRCPAGGINQGFLNEDIPELLNDIPLWIIERQKRTSKDTYVRFRVQSLEKKRIEQDALKKGFPNTAEYLRHLVLHN